MALPPDILAALTGGGNTGGTQEQAFVYSKSAYQKAQASIPGGRDWAAASRGVGKPTQVWGTLPDGTKGWVDTTPNFSIPVADALAIFDDLDNDAIRTLAAKLAMAGYAGSISKDKVSAFVDDASKIEVRDAYMNLLNDAADRYASGKNIDPMDLLDEMVKFRAGDANIFDEDGNLDMSKVGTYGKPRTVTTTSTSRDILNPDDARAITQGILQQELGRDPTDAEYEDFVDTLQAAVKRNPRHTTTTSRYDADGNLVSQDQTTSGGMSESALALRAQEEARSQPDWAEWQAVGTYAPALMQALGATVNVGD